MDTKLYTLKEKLCKELDEYSGKDESALVFSEGYLSTQIQRLCSTPLFEKTIKDGNDGIHVLGSRIDFETDCIKVIAYYTVKPLIDIANNSQFMVNCYCVKRWTGYSEQKTSVQEEYVYVTDNRSVYHISEKCSYLKLTISKVEKEKLKDLRNDWGAKYTSCYKCCKEDNIKEIYYVTKYGDRFHENIACAGLKRTIQYISKKEVENLPMCSRCNEMLGE